MLYYGITHFLLSLKSKRRSMGIYVDVQDIDLSSMRLKHSTKAILQVDQRRIAVGDVV